VLHKNGERSRYLDGSEAKVKEAVLRTPFVNATRIDAFPCSGQPGKHSESLLFSGGDTGSTPVRGRQHHYLNIHEVAVELIQPRSNKKETLQRNPTGGAWAPPLVFWCLSKTN
jgi:hypothetical protein